MSSVHRIRLVRSLGVCSVAAISAIAACGGSTDIDFTGQSGGSSGASAMGGGGNVGGTGNTGGHVDGGAGGTLGGSGGTSGGGGGPIGGSSGASGGAGAPPVVCGGVACPPPNIPFGQVESCCVGDKCGITSSFLGSQCFELNQPGKLDPTCPTQTIQGFTLQGCCKPSKICGVMDTFLGLGCVDPSPITGQPPIPCGGGTGGFGGMGGIAGASGIGGAIDAGPGGTGGAIDAGIVGEKNCGITNPAICTASENCCVLDPGLDYCSSSPCACTQPGCDITVVSCDGPEDCPGQICCGTYSFQQQQYTTLACKSTCSANNEREICKPGVPCTNPNQTCSTSPSLPPYLYRCN